VLKPCLNELKALKQGKRVFPAIQEYLRANSVHEISTEAQSADKAILDYAREHGAVVATLDYVLRKRLKKAGVQTITLKGRTIVSPWKIEKNRKKSKTSKKTENWKNPHFFFQKTVFSFKKLF